MPTLADLRKTNPELEGLDDARAINVLQMGLYPDMTREQVAKELGVKLVAPPDPNADGQMVSGFKRSFQEVPGLMAGVGAFAADAVGATGARDSMLDYYKQREEQVGQQHANDAASITDAWDGKTSWGDFLANAAGYTAGQALQSLLTGGLGALGARMLVKTGAKQAAEKAAAEAIAHGASRMEAEGSARNAAAAALKEAADAGDADAQKALAESVAQKTIMNRAATVGAGVGAGSQNFGMELGSIYPDAVDQAHAEGRETDGGDLARVLGSAGVAAGLETATEGVNLSRVLKGGKGGIMGRVAREVPEGMAREAGTEAAQTAIEHYGAGQPIADEKGLKDIIDSAGVGAVGGALAGMMASSHGQPAPGPNTRAVADGMVATVRAELDQPPPPPGPSPEQAAALLKMANERYAELKAKEKGDEKNGPQFLTPNEAREAAFLKKNGGDANALAQAGYDVPAPDKGAAARELAGAIDQGQPGAAPVLQPNVAAAPAAPAAPQAPIAPSVAPDFQGAQQQQWQGGYILNPKGQPYKTEMAATLAAKKHNGEVVPVEGGFAIKPAEETTNAQEQQHAPSPAPVEAPRAEGQPPAAVDGATRGVEARQPAGAGTAPVESAGVADRSTEDIAAQAARLLKKASDQRAQATSAGQAIDKQTTDARAKLAPAPAPAVTPPARTKTKKKTVTREEWAAKRADYFTPGNIVKSYGGHDRVISYTPANDQGDWSVKVQAVKKVDGEWVDADNRVRQHSTAPDTRELAEGPVQRAPAASPAPAPAEKPKKAKATKAPAAPAPAPAAEPEPHVALYAKAHADERPGDVLLSNDKYVSLKDAKAAAREAIDAGTMRNVPFHMGHYLGIAPKDWQRMVGELETPAPRSDEEKAGGNPHEWSGRAAFKADHPRIIPPEYEDKKGANAKAWLKGYDAAQDEAAPAPAPPPAEPAVSKNTIFTEDAAAKARARLRAKLNGSQLNSGIDPEMLMDGITLAGYHLEKGARTFAAYAKAMLADLGDGAKPYLKSWYMGVKYDPRASAFDGMDDASTVEKFNFDAATTAAVEAPAKKSAAERREAAQAIYDKATRFASGLSRTGEIETAGRAVGEGKGIGVDVGELSDKGLDALAHAAVAMRAPVFVDSGAFSAFKRGLKTGGLESINFDDVLARYDSLLLAIDDANPAEERDYPRPMLVMPDVVGDQAASLELARKYARWIKTEATANLSQPIIPIQTGDKSMAEVYRELVDILGTDNFSVGIPSNAAAVTPEEFTQFLRDAQPKAVHILGAAASSRLMPRLESIVDAGLDGKIEVTADASPIRSAIIKAVEAGAERGAALADFLHDGETKKLLAENEARHEARKAEKAAADDPHPAWAEIERLDAQRRELDKKQRSPKIGIDSLERSELIRQMDDLDRQMRKLEKEAYAAQDADLEEIGGKALHQLPKWLRDDPEAADEFYTYWGDALFDQPEGGSVRAQDEEQGELDIKEARERLSEWAKTARMQGRTGKNADKVVLSLFDATGNWAQPWHDAGYTVITMDVRTGQNIKSVDMMEHLEEAGLMDGNVEAILAACPCTDFSNSGNRWKKGKAAKGKIAQSVDLVAHTKAVIEILKPKVWAIENPDGQIETVAGLPAPRLRFQPFHYGDPYSKKTNLFGKFNPHLPQAQVEPSEGSKMQQELRGDSPGDKAERSRTPLGFAYAFFMANGGNIVGTPVEPVKSFPEGVSGELFNADGMLPATAGIGEDQDTFQERLNAQMGDIIAWLDANRLADGGIPTGRRGRDWAFQQNELARLRGLYEDAGGDAQPNGLTPGTFRHGEDRHGKYIQTPTGLYRVGDRVAAHFEPKTDKQKREHPNGFERTGTITEIPPYAWPKFKMDGGMPTQVSPTNLLRKLDEAKAEAAPRDLASYAKGELVQAHDRDDGWFDTVVTKATPDGVWVQGLVAPSVSQQVIVRAEDLAPRGTHPTVARQAEDTGTTAAERKAKQRDTAASNRRILESLRDRATEAGAENLASRLNALALSDVTPATVRDIEARFDHLLAKAQKNPDEQFHGLENYRYDYAKRKHNADWQEIDDDAARELEGAGKGALAGEPAEGVQADARGRDAGEQPGRGGDGDLGADANADRGGVQPAGGVGDDARGAPVPAGGKRRKPRGTSKRGVQDGGRGERGAEQPADSGLAGGLTPPNEAPNAAPVPPPAFKPADFTIDDSYELGQGGPKLKFRQNLEAIQIVKELEREGRPATTAEQRILGRYVGWGGLAAAFDGDKADWAAEHAQLKAELTEEEYAAAARSTRYAHYTSREVVQGIYDALAHMGFTGGNVLESSAGVGNFIGLMPAALKAASNFTAVERDPISASIAKHLYPNQSVRQEDFTEHADGNSDDYYDAAVGNPPFASDPQVDKSGRKHLNRLSLHNYFFAKMVDMLREGGILAQVVTNSFLDAKTDTARRYISDRTKFLGAIRLPNNAFSQNAGTEVTTDLVFLQKRPEAEWGSKAAREDAKRWLGVGEHNGVALNQYFVDHPDMMLGDFGPYGTMYGPGQPALVARGGQDTGALLKAAVSRLPAAVFTPAAVANTKQMTEGAIEAISNPPVQENGYFSEGGKLKQRVTDQGGQARAKEITPNTQWTEKTVLGESNFKRIQALAGMRTTLRALLAAELSDDAKMETLRKELNAQYDAFTKEHGLISDKATARVFDDDPDYPLLMSLEHGYTPAIGAAAAKSMGIKPVKATAQKAPIFARRVVEARKKVAKVATPADALAVSMAERGRLDADYIGELLGRDPKEVLEELSSGAKPLLFLDPADNGYVLRDAYLSGNVRAKLAQARQAGLFMNIQALEEVQPEDVGAHEITARLGSPWVPTRVYEDFAKALLGEGTRASVTYIPANAAFQASIRPGSTTANTNTWGTNEYPADELLPAIMNNRQIKVTYKDADGATHTDVAATEKANFKAQELREKFSDWLFNDPDRSELLTRAYNDTNNNYVTREYDGSWMTFPGKVPDSVIKFRRHQRNAIARIVQDRTALLDHVVGAGKTFTIISAAMELKRTGLAKKPLIAVPNHLVKQWAADFYRLYPGANILTATKKDFERTNRRRFLAKIATGDWDAVIIAHSSFGFIKPSPEFEAKFNTKQVAVLRQTIQAIEGGEGDTQQKKRSVKQIEGMLERLENRIKALRDKPMDALLDFGQIGVDQLFVDEAHLFKNLMFSTKMANVAGLGDAKGSQRAYDMYLKANQVFDRNGRGQGLVFATGTPVSNSLAEMYHMMRYLMPAQMEEMGFQSFDAWANTFAAVEQVWMQKASADGFKAQNRMGTFVNTPELLKVFDQVSDTVTMDDIKRAFSEENEGKEFPLPKLKGGKRTPMSLRKSKAQDDYMAAIAQRALAIEQRRGPPQAGQDNILVVMGDARKAAMDVRLVDPKATTREPGGRIDRAAQEIAARYKQHDAVKGTQLVFSDLGTPLKTVKKELEEYQALRARVDALTEEVKVAANLGDEAAQAKVDDSEAASLELFAKGNDWLDAIEAALRGFSVYDDLKLALVEQGIPEGEIAFIHDFNTDEQKAGLFRKVNAGQIRVLMGSTSKMGAGTNVQERLVALHHLDVPWKPSDVEQREGRIIRQGNKLADSMPDFEVEILAYVTQDTLDMRMWQVQETKLKMINQLRTRKIARQIDNAFEDMELSAGEMQAAATGNIDLLREIQTRADIKTLEQKKRAFDAQKNDLINRRKGVEADLASLPPKIAKTEHMLVAQDAYEAEAAERQSRFKVTINGKEYTDAAEAGRVLREHVNAKSVFKLDADGKATKEEIPLEEYEALPEEKQAGYKAVAKKLAVNMNGTDYTSRTTLGEDFAALRGDAAGVVPWTLDGKELSAREAIASAITTAAKDALAEESERSLGTIGPFAVTVEGQTDRFDRPMLEVVLTYKGDSVSTTILESSTPIGRQVVDSAINLATQARNALSYQNYRLEMARKQKAELDATPAAGDWPDQPKLDEARARHRRLLQALSAAKLKVEPEAPGTVLDTPYGDMAQPNPADNESDVLWSRSGSARPEHAALRELSKNDDLYALPKSSATTVEGVAADINPKITVRKVAIPGETRYNVTLPSGKTARIMVREPNPYGQTVYGFEHDEDGAMQSILADRPGENPEDVPPTGDVWIDASLSEPGAGGAAVYAIAATYAHNTGRIFIGDPAGLSDDAMFRRPEAMLSSALKEGTTRHLAPHPRQVAGDAALGIPPLRWVYGDHLGNIRRLIELNLAAQDNGGSDISFDPKTGHFLDSHGQQLDTEAIDQLAREAGIGRGTRSGRRTLARAAILRALLQEARRGGQGENRGRNGVLARLAGLDGQLAPDTRGVFARGEGTSGGLKAADVQALADKITAGWANRPDVVVVQDLTDSRIPPALRRGDAELEGVGEGVFHKGKVYLIAGNLRSDADVLRVLMHESLGHFGLRGVFGAKLVPILDRLATLNKARVQEKARAYGLDFNTQDGRRIAAEEVLAEMAQESPTLGWVKQAIAAIRSWLRANVPGFSKMALSDAEIVRDFILPARRHVEGGPSGGPGRGTPALEGARFSRKLGATLAQAGRTLRDVQLPAGYVVGDLFSSAGKLSWWDKTVGTPFHLAQKSAPFRRVYDSVQQFLNDVSYYAAESQDLAPRILPRLDGFRDLGKQALAAADEKAIAAPIFEGTLSWVRGADGKIMRLEKARETAAKMSTDEMAEALWKQKHVPFPVVRMWKGRPDYATLIKNAYEAKVLSAGVVFSDNELANQFKLNPKQIGLYKEFRKAIDRSLDNMAISDMLRFGGRDVAPVRDRVMGMTNAQQAAEFLRDYLTDQADAHEARSKVLLSTAKKIMEKGARAADLKARGYAPLSRFGEYTLDVVNDKGERIYFSLFENTMDRGKMARELAQAYPKATIRLGTTSQEEYRMFAGVSPETLALFGEMLGLEEGGESDADKAFQQYIKLAKSNRSAMKRLIERKGIAGFSQDTSRVLAGFVYSNARQTSANLHLGEMTDAVQAIPQGQGQIKDAAVKLVEYARTPQEEAQALRGLLFAQYLGGSVASAMINATQPLAITFPYLTQFLGVRGAASQMTAAVADALKKTTGDKALDAALKRAEEEGIVSPQEVHSLQAQAGGRAQLVGGDGTAKGNAYAAARNTWSKAKLAWGQVFSIPEQWNRRVTFIAAYRTAVAKKMPNPAAFAANAVAETQFTYNRGNKPAWARGALGSVLFTFKQYSISYLELLHRMYNNGPEGKKAALLALAVLFLMAGTDGLPGADDLDDLIDGLLQRLGYNFSTKQAKRQFFASVLGEGGAQFVAKGLSGLPGVPIDFSGRTGMGNLIPGTGLLTKKPDHTRDALEIAGPAADMGQRAFKAGSALAEGKVGEAVGGILPQAARNAMQAWNMATAGQYTDDRGYKVLETTPMEAAAKAIGFQPASVAKVQEAAGESARYSALHKMRVGEIETMWAEGIAEGKPELVAQAQAARDAWNEKNPDVRLKVDMPAVLRKAKEMRKDRATRVEEAAPKGVRQKLKADMARAMDDA